MGVDPIAADTGRATAQPAAPAAAAATPTLHRQLGWTGAFWAASGVPAGVLLTIGGIAATIGQPSWVDLDRLDPDGLPPVVHLRRDRRLVPAQVRRRLGLRRQRLARVQQVRRPDLGVVQLAGLVAGAGPGHRAGCRLRHGQSVPGRRRDQHLGPHLVDLGFIHAGLNLRINAVFFIAAVFLLATFAMQHRGIARAARMPDDLGIASLLPLVILSASCRS